MSDVLDLLRRANMARDKLYPGSEKIDVAFRAVELGGEVGELLNQIKKWERSKRGIAGNAALSTDEIYRNISEEVGDVLICLDLLCMDLGIDLSISTVNKFNASSEKLGLHVHIEPDWKEA